MSDNENVSEKVLKLDKLISEELSKTESESNVRVLEKNRLYSSSIQICF